MKIASICLRLYFSEWQPVATQSVMKTTERLNPHSTHGHNGDWWWVAVQDYCGLNVKQRNPTQSLPSVSEENPNTASKWFVLFNPSPVSALGSSFFVLVKLVDNCHPNTSLLRLAFRTCLYSKETL